jgi:hypothetical protein
MELVEEEGVIDGDGGDVGGDDGDDWFDPQIDQCTAEGVEEQQAGGGKANAADKPDCTDAGKQKRMEEEKKLQKQLFDNGCLPNNLGADPCKSIHAAWKKVKDANATCNAQSKGCSLCDYYKAAIVEYEKRIKDHCPNGPLPQGVTGLTIPQYCNYAKLSLDYFKERKEEECIVIGLLDGEGFDALPGAAAHCWMRT